MCPLNIQLIGRKFVINLKYSGNIKYTIVKKTLKLYGNIFKISFLKLIYKFSLLFPSSKPSQIPHLVFFKSRGFFFMKYYRNICMYIYISKCNLLSLYNVTCMCMLFLTNRLVLDNQFECSFLGKTISLNLRIP